MIKKLRKACIAIGLTGLITLTSCQTLRDNEHDLALLAKASTAIALEQTPAEKRKETAERLRQVAGAVEALTSIDADPDHLTALFFSFIGRDQPEYVILASVLTDYWIRYSSGAEAIPERDVIRRIAAGIRAAAEAYL